MREAFKYDVSYVVPKKSKIIYKLWQFPMLSNIVELGFEYISSISPQWKYSYIEPCCISRRCSPVSSTNWTTVPLIAFWNTLHIIYIHMAMWHVPNFVGVLTLSPISNKHFRFMGNFHYFWIVLWRDIIKKTLWITGKLKKL